MLINFYHVGPIGVIFLKLVTFVRTDKSGPYFDQFVSVRYHDRQPLLRLHETTSCQTGCTTGLTTGFTVDLCQILRRRLFP